VKSLPSVTLILALGFLVSGCATSVEPSSTPVTTLAESVESESDLRTAETFVIRDAVTFARVWTQLFRARRELPTIDFSTQMIVVATMGQQPSAGYAIKITGSRRSDRGLIVYVTTASPSTTCSTAAVITYPVAIARLPRYDGQVRFEFTRTTRDCSGR